MNKDAAASTAAWLRASRDGTTQEALARDISRVTGWNLTRDRYSKYESGSLPIGPTVLRHFTDYWASRGVDGPESYMEKAAGDRENPGGLSDLASAISALVEELRLSREARLDLQERVEALETAAKLQARPDAGAAGAPTAPLQTR